MDQNALRASHVPLEWHDLYARWSEGPGDDDSAGPTFEALDGRRTLVFAAAARAAVGDDWLSFRLRQAHPAHERITPMQAPYLLAVRVKSDDEDRGEFRRWLDEEHCRRQVSLRDVRWFLGYEQVGSEHSFLNLWGLDDPDVVDGEAWVSARDTPWWKRISHVPANSDRGIFRRLVRK